MHVVYSLREWVEGTYDDFSGVKIHIDDGGAVNIILFFPVAAGV